MKQSKLTGYLLITGALGVLIPYIILTVTFDYPGILRDETGEILRRFKEGGSSLIFTWLAFGLSGIPLMIGYIQMGRQMETRYAHVRWVTIIGVISGVVQIIGLLRWVFVVPVLADRYQNASEPVLRSSIAMIFETVHQFAGVLLGEHLGQLFTVIWIVGMNIALMRGGLIAAWIGWWGYLAAGIYLLGQAEFLATAIPWFPAWELSSFLGSTFWLIWLIMIGIFFIRNKSEVLQG